MTIVIWSPYDRISGVVHSARSRMRVARYVVWHFLFESEYFFHAETHPTRPFRQMSPEASDERPIGTSDEPLN
jgi:hypothetical protein